MNETLLYIGNQTSFAEICRLNQAAMLEATEKIPSTGYYILLIGLVSLLFYFFVQPYLLQTWKDQLLYYPGLLGTSLVFLSAWILALSVFELTEVGICRIIRFTSFLFLPLLLLLGYKIYRRYLK